MKKGAIFFIIFIALQFLFCILRHVFHVVKYEREIEGLRSGAKATMRKCSPFQVNLFHHKKGGFIRIAKRTKVGAPEAIAPK